MEPVVDLVDLAEAPVAVDQAGVECLAFLRRSSNKSRTSRFIFGSPLKLRSWAKEMRGNPPGDVGIQDGHAHAQSARAEP